MMRIPAVALLAVLAAACAPTLSSKPTATPGGPKVVRPDSLEAVWHGRLTEPQLLRYKPRERAQPAWDEGRGWLFVGDREGVVHALDAEGRSLWTFQTLGAVDAGLVLTRERLYVASTGGYVYALDPESGEKLWEYQTGSEFVTTPTLAAGRLLVPSLSNTVVALDAATGEFQWFHRRPVPTGLTIRGTAGVSVIGDRGITAFSDGTVVALSIEDGSVLWERTFGGTGQYVDIDTTPVIVGDRVYVASYGRGIHALSLADGADLWSVDEMPGAVSLSRAADVLVVLAPEKAAGYRLVDGRKVWETRLVGGTPSPGVVSGETVFVGTEDGPLYGIAGRSGKPTVAFAPGTGISAPPVLTDGGLWVLSNGGTLFRLARR